jgi:hypothetical protein
MISLRMRAQSQTVQGLRLLGFDLKSLAVDKHGRLKAPGLVVRACNAQCFREGRHRNILPSAGQFPYEFSHMPPAHTGSLRLGVGRRRLALDLLAEITRFVYLQSKERP